MPYTPQQASEMLRIPLSTLRRYAALFGEHLSVHSRRKRRYSEQDIATLARIRELYSESKTPEQISALLAVVSDTEQQPAPQDTLMLVPGISAALTEALDTARALRSQVQQLTERQAESESKLSETQQALSQALERLEQLEQRERERSVPWYQRILKR